MAIYTIKAVALSDLIVSGPDPFSGDTGTNSSAITNHSTIRLPSGTDWRALSISDSDTGSGAFDDTDQELASSVSFNGRSWSAGIDVEAEYSYVLRPVGSTDPADYVTIYVLQFDGGAVQGITANKGLARDVTYEIISGNGSPAASYSDLVICLAEGTEIATPKGPRPVEDLREGDRVETLDNGARPLAWVGRRQVAGRGPTAPVEVAAGALGNARTLVLSPQHRVLVRACPGLGLPEGAEVLVPVKALVGRPGIEVVERPGIVYCHLLFAGHEVIFAAGAPVESLYPGPMALKALRGKDRAAIRACFPELAQGRIPWPPARPLIRPGQWVRASGPLAPD